MPATLPKKATTIKVIPSDDVLLVPGGEIRTDRENGLPENCFIVPMQVLDEPEPVRTPRPKSR
jgi:hypothetical protein